MADDLQANWDCLPHNPLGFFGLTQDFERRDLKRAYGKFIRQFKPETHPEHFQQIRAAYEQLESANRYGTQQSLVQLQKDAWSSATAVESSSVAATDQAPIRSRFDRAIESPKEAYQELSESNQRTAQDYFLLAVLSDLFDKGERTLFIKWIMRGLKEHPSDSGL